jgi:hypothetical protein
MTSSYSKRAPCVIIDYDQDDVDEHALQYYCTEFPVIKFDAFTHEDSGHRESPGHR